MDYRQSDVEVVYRRGDWHSWGDIVHWLERGLSRDQQADNELSEAESRQLLDDFRKLDQQGTEFIDDPGRAYRQLQSIH
ncbi:hypothetical protein B0E53_03977 [Micromonospora sp. MH33]|uniref:hypothetical protein n=1 Tax=Micromonospora sp. MH33 TaxID=1945509 RepID=UPI000D14B9E6|nr:hypothetical protein [Micromonospora sp. MH33]PSK64072.1 hypothetical protein B0E53_03977 [Micromonospora sp. MH33]